MIAWRFQRTPDKAVYGVYPERSTLTIGTVRKVNGGWFARTPAGNPFGTLCPTRNAAAGLLYVRAGHPL